MSKKIRDPEAYNAACEERFARREQRINQIIDRIEYIVRREADFYGKIQDVVWQLRRKGVLGKCDRKKDRFDDYGKDIVEALERARDDENCPIVVQNGMTGIIVSHRSRPDNKQVGSTKPMGRESRKLPMKFIRKYENVEYPVSLFVHPSDSVDVICDVSNPLFKSVKGSLPRELVEH